MSRLAGLFEACRTEDRSALIGYLPTGFPDVPTSISAMTALVEAGCDIVEVGIAYSDPGMDGPVIAAAAETALHGGVRVRDALAAVEAISNAGGRAVVMTYWNPVLRRGVDAFARDLASAGGLGMITPDLIPDEADEWLSVSDAHNLDRIFLVAPSSTPERLAATVEASRGFVYAASTMGVTGARDAVSVAAPELVGRVKAVSDIPVGVGLGVRSREQAAQIGAYADGVIVGSALVSALNGRYRCGSVADRGTRQWRAAEDYCVTTTVLAYIPSPSQGVWHLGPLPLRAYALFIVAGMVAALLIGDKRWQERGGEPGVIYSIFWWAMPFGLIGGRLYHVITDWQTYFGDDGAGFFAAFRIWEGGLGIWGAVALGGVGAWIGCRQHGIPLPAFGDAVAPGIVLAQAIGRLGNYFNQELYGRPTTLPWGLEIYERRDAGGYLDSLNGVSTGQLVEVVHPTFLYELLWNVLVFAALIYIDRRFKIGHGRLFAMYVAGYCVGRFWIELMRSDHASMPVEGIRVNSFTATFVFIGAVVYIMVAPKGREDPATLKGNALDDEEDTAVEEFAKELTGVAAATTGVVAAAKVAGEFEDEDAKAVAEEEADDLEETPSEEAEPEADEVQPAEVEAEAEADEESESAEAAQETEPEAETEEAEPEAEVAVDAAEEAKEADVVGRRRTGDRGRRRAGADGGRRGARTRG